MFGIGIRRAIHSMKRFWDLTVLYSSTLKASRSLNLKRVLEEQEITEHVVVG
jgi:hypothetical protein